MTAPFAVLVASLALAPALPEDRPAPAEPSIATDAVLGAVEGERVRVTSGMEERIGVLRSISDESIVLVGDDGEVFEVERATIRAVELAPLAAAPPAAPTTTVIAPVVGMCLGDESCEYPRKCIDGQCRIDPAYVDALEEEGQHRRKYGMQALIAGASVTAAGLVVMVVGVATYKHRDDCFDGRIEADSFDELEDRCRRPDDISGKDWVREAQATAIAGGIITFLGGVIMAGGGGAYAMGKNKLRRVEQYRDSLRLELSAGRHGAQLGLRGRF